MTSCRVPDVKALAGQARELAAAALPGSLERKAAGCCAVALGTTRTLKAARQALDDVPLVDVRDVASALLNHLTTTEQEGLPT